MKLNNILHRDLGYFFAGVIMIYAISGIAINHLHDWNPNYSVKSEEVKLDLPTDYTLITKEMIKKELQKYSLENAYKKHYFPRTNRMKIFIKDGTIYVDLDNGYGLLEVLSKRPLIAEMNYLHYNPNMIWTVYSDVFSFCLIIITITGMIVLKGKKGFKRYGLWLFLGGFVFPIFVLILFYY